MLFPGRRALVVLPLLLVVLLTSVAQAASTGASGSWSVMGAARTLPAFYLPAGLAIGGRGNLYLADSGNFQIVKLTPGGRVLNRFGTRGAGPGSFGASADSVGPQSVAVDQQGNVYVADTGNARVEKFTAGGRYLAGWDLKNASYLVRQLAMAVAPDNSIVVAIGAVVACPHDCATYYIVQRRNGNGVLLAEWQSENPPSGPQNAVANPYEVLSTIAVAVGPRGTIFVATTGLEACYKSCPELWALDRWASSGQRLGAWSGSTFYSHPAFPTAVAIDGRGQIYLAEPEQNRVEIWSSAGKMLRTLSNFGPGPYRVVSPHGIALGSHGTIYVSEQFSQQVLTLAPSGKVVAQLGTGGSAPGKFWSPEDVATDRSGTAWVADVGNGRVQHLSADGRVLGGFPVPFIGPALALDAGGNLYLSRHVGSEIILARYSPAGKVLAQWGKLHLEDQPSGIAVGANGAMAVSARFYFPYVVNQPPDPRNGDDILVLSKQGAQQTLFHVGNVPGSFGNVRAGIVWTADGNLLVADPTDARIDRYTAGGQLLSSWWYAKDQRPIRTPFQTTALAEDGKGMVYLSDGRRNHIREYTDSGKLVAQWAGAGPSPGQIHRPEGVAVDIRGRLWVSDTGNNRVQVLTR